jgi:hypothetical protein
MRPKMGRIDYARAQSWPQSFAVSRYPKLSGLRTVELVRNGYHHHEADELAANLADSELSSIYHESGTSHETSAHGSHHASSLREGVN